MNMDLFVQEGFGKTCNEASPIETETGNRAVYLFGHPNAGSKVQTAQYVIIWLFGYGHGYHCSKEKQ